MKLKSIVTKTALLLAALLAFNSCKQLTESAFVPSVVGSDPNAAKTVLAPEDLTATQGGRRKITLSWLPVSTAKYYLIYWANSPNEEFVLLDVTDKTTYEDNVSPGRTVYYKVKTEKADGKISDFSEWAKGTSLAVPLISKGEFGENEVTIYWYMQNAKDINTDESNYSEKLMFNVVCEKKNSDIKYQAALDGDQTSFTFTGLDSNAQYLYYVESYVTSDQSAIETSEKVDVETLHNFVPETPEFTITRGLSKSDITLSFDLPQMVYVTTVTGTSDGMPTIEEYPLCFKIARRLHGEKEYKKICTLYYNEKEIAPDVSDVDSNVYVNNPYTQGTRITWKDTGLLRGQQYDYRITSVVDTVYSKVIDAHYTTDLESPEPKENIGWLCPVPEFCITNSEGTEEDAIDFKENETKTEYESISFKLKAELKEIDEKEKADSKYIFAVKQKYTKFGESTSTDLWLDKNGTSDKMSELTLQEINDRIIEMKDLENEKGYYNYELYVFLKDAFEAEKVIDKQAAAYTVTVSNVIARPNPVIQEVKDGYTDEISVKFKNEDGADYYLYRYMYDDDGSISEPTRIPADNADFIDTSSPEDGVVTCKDESLEPGKKYGYILYAQKGGFFVASPMKEGETLGKPEPRFVEEKLAYDSITVTMKKVLGVKSYKITLGESAVFGGGKTLEFDKEGTITAVTMDSTTTVELLGDTFNITLNKPEGYDNASLAGTKVKLNVAATSDSDQPSDSDPIDVYVLGPAMIGKATVNDFDGASDDVLTLTWKKVPQAKGYIIRRVMYSDMQAKTVFENTPQTYYYDTKKITVDGKAVDDGQATCTGFNGKVNRATVTLEGENYILHDTYAASDANINPENDAFAYQKSQEKIAWGYPFKYVVLPVLDDKDKDDFVFEDEGFNFADESKYKYTNLEVTDPIATFGYGIDIAAAKAENGFTQTVTWKKPFYAESNDLSPLLYRRSINSTRNNWLKITASFDTDKESASYTVEKDFTSDAFDYIVKFVPSSTKNSKIVNSYIEYLKSVLETRYDYGAKKREPRNKGYLLYSGFNAGYGGTRSGESSYVKDENYYSEVVTLIPWDYDQRTLGPDSYKIEIFNPNLLATKGNGWTLVGSYDADLKDFSANGDLAAKDTTVQPVEGGGVRLKPTSISGRTDNKGTTDGVLKILRTAAHYYRITLLRSEDTYSATIGNDYSKYAYRQITHEELMKSTMLTFAQIIRETIKDHGTGTKGITIYGYDGKSTFFWSQDSGSNLVWQINAYTAVWTELPNGDAADMALYKKWAGLPSFLSIIDRNPDKDNRGARQSAGLKQLSVCDKNSVVNVIGYPSFNKDGKIPLTVSPSDAYDITLESYNETVSFAVNLATTFYGVVGTGTTATTFEDTKTIYTYFPGNMNEKDENGLMLKDTEYGWWPAE